MFNFLYVLKVPETKRQYPRRLEIFLDFLGLNGDVNAKALLFYKKAKANPQWFQDNFLKFIEYQKDRVSRNELSLTIGNYYKATKLFCEMNDITINWKLVTKDIPSGKKASNDRTPTTEQIKKITEYRYRRIESIVSVMISSGIRLGAWDYLK